jgi:hypothetical protein
MQGTYIVDHTYAKHKMHCIHWYNILQPKGRIYTTSMIATSMFTMANVVSDDDVENVGALQFWPREYWWRLISSFVFVVLYHFPPATFYHHSQNTMTSIDGWHFIYQQYMHWVHLHLFRWVLLWARGINQNWHTNIISLTFVGIWRCLGNPTAFVALNLTMMSATNPHT